MENNLKDRTKKFALRIVTLVRTLPKDIVGQTFARQLIRSGTSVAANYRATQRARSKAEFIAKMGIVLEEADETVFWLEMLIETNLVSPEKLEPLLKEANEVTSIIVTSIQTARKNKAKK